VLFSRDFGLFREISPTRLNSLIPAKLHYRKYEDLSLSTSNASNDGTIGCRKE
jgi:hypothetical protein